MTGQIYRFDEEAGRRFPLTRELELYMLVRLALKLTVDSKVRWYVSAVTRRLYGVSNGISAQHQLWAIRDRALPAWLFWVRNHARLWELATSVIVRFWPGRQKSKLLPSKLAYPNDVTPRPWTLSVASWVSTLSTLVFYAEQNKADGIKRITDFGKPLPGSPVSSVS